MTFKISLGMIVKNEGQTLNECLLSVAPFVDEIVIGYGGKSTDDTEKIVQEFIDDGYPVTTFPIEWNSDFSEARNQVLDRVTGDYFLWIDGDDVLLGGEHLRRMIQENPNVDSFFMGYDYAHDEKGNTICYLIRERVVRLQDELEHRGWRWIGKVHEVMESRGFTATPKMVDDIVVQHHKPGDKHDPNRNANILYDQLAAQEPNPDPRILGYLCTENQGRGNFKEAILHAQRFVQLSGWDEEKYQMQHRISDMLRQMGNLDAALVSDFKAIAIKPDWPDAYFGLAETYNALENWNAVIEWTKAGASKKQPKTMLIINPLDYTYFPAIILAGAFTHLGDYKEALANYEQAFQFKQEPLIHDQMVMLSNEIHLHDVTEAFLLIREHLGRNDEWLKVRRLFDVVPKHIEQHPAIQETWKRSMFQTGHIDDPSIMEEFYTDNPHWQSVDEERIQDPGWLDYPRMRFALDTARRIKAKTIVDWGCSDGFIALPLARETGAHVTGFDLDPRCIDLATLRGREWGVDTRFQVGNVDQIGGWEGEKADLAIFFEVIEHVVDPIATLERVEKTAKHIAITTPFMSWEGGNIPAWDRLEPKGHLRIFDTYDIERLFYDRGKIWNLYKQEWGNTGWIFADYEPGVGYDKRIIIGAMGAPEDWNPRKIAEQGAGGSELAVMSLAEAFSRAGHESIVYTNTSSPGYYNGVCYRPNNHFRPKFASDVYIAWRQPEAADWNIDTKQLYLWMHDTDAGDRLTEDRAYKFDKIIVLTEWHKKNMMEKYPFIKEDKYVIIGNGVKKARFKGEPKKNPKKVIYSSSPDRGLDIILESIWPKVIEQVPDAELHIYYGWVNFAIFSPQFPHLKEFQDRVQGMLATAKGVIQHGRVNQDELAKGFMEANAWLYPTYFSETYCITGVEAQLAGAIPITNQTAALAETVKTGIFISGDVHDEAVQQQYVEAVVQVLNGGISSEQRQKVRENAPAHTWTERATQWLELFEKGEVVSG
jgi:glycosyltransferase involved in cell wall biosynthesis